MLKIIASLMELSQVLQTPPEIKSFISQISDLFRQERNSYVSKRFSPGSIICPRLKAFQRIEGFHLTFEEPDDSQVRLFEMGTAIHKKLQNEILPRLGRSWGNWVCPSCGVKKSMQIKPPYKCTSRIEIINVGEDPILRSCTDSPSKGEWLYQEVFVKGSPFQDPLYETSAFIDHVYIENNQWFILEIKSVSDNIFEGYSTSKHPEHEKWKIQKPWITDMPKDNHVRQAQICGTLLNANLKEQKIPAPAETYGGVMLLYINRNNLDMRAYKLPPSDQPYKELVEIIDNTRSAVQQKLPMHAKPCCTKRTSTMAKICPKRDVCFPLKRAKKVK